MDLLLSFWRKVSRVTQASDPMNWCKVGVGFG